MLVRTYGQYCSLAKALDVVGDRWTLLIIRELALRGACRYTDLRGGLPGIATNLLADRLRELESAGVIERRDAPPPVATALFELTDRGRELIPVLHDLGRWGAPLMAGGPADGDEFRVHWLAWPAEVFLADHEPDEPPVTVALRIGDETMVTEAREGEIHVRSSAGEPTDASLAGSAQTVLGVISGHLPLAQAEALGATFEGSRGALARIQPQALAA